ncbi:hypothetical protein GUITHDRAFT_140472 [Guillardia theta CCMP2712]|uniref:F-box domain-containing protein n=1 Tax=Guillardia theta (strain CCMP2712) TaxID=905079 RepID=L1J5M4_GUITC|nr:hypothetical protein GUITHDRAFT_140472 [Guillardia theta CCMP2712]EKX43424.1 hypothetical protein GUITHDRAFT_140472 [Guillardia theta CCMP2712]|eukprot:XP_005830404.1 hypothetical protein GUITHDRAFT_140472 [Guillardia theta CCMP2712]
MAASSSCSWTALSTDIYVKIFSQLSPHDTPRCALVCSYWKNAANEDSLWRGFCGSHSPPFVWRGEPERTALTTWKNLFKARDTCFSDRVGKKRAISLPLRMQGGYVRCMVVEEPFLVCGSENGMVTLFSYEKLRASFDGMKECKPLCVIKEQSQWVYSVCAQIKEGNSSHPSILIASGSRDMTAQLYEVSTKDGVKYKHEILNVFHGHKDWIAHVSWTHDRNALISAGNDGMLFVWDFTKKKERGMVQVETGIWQKEDEIVLSKANDTVEIVNYVKFERVRRIQFGDELDFRTYGCFVSFVLPSMVLAGINNSVVAMNAAGEELYKVSGMETWLLRISEDGQRQLGHPADVDADIGEATELRAVRGSVEMFDLLRLSCRTRRKLPPSMCFINSRAAASGGTRR